MIKLVIILNVIVGDHHDRKLGSLDPEFSNLIGATYEVSKWSNETDVLLHNFFE